jgi:hypothetical protein
MNLESFPSTPFYIQEDGYLPVEWQNYFSMNSQEFELFFNNVGHLVPSRTNSDIAILNTAAATNPTLFKARSLYNNDTSNLMGNIEGTYLNYTMNILSTRASLLSMSLLSNVIQLFGDEDSNSYLNINGTLNQIPTNTTTSTGVLNFSVDGSGNLFSTINGVTRQIQFV